MTRTTCGIVLAALLAGMTALEARAEVALPPVFGTGMVLQRGGPIPVWGTAKPREEVRVAIAGQTQKTRADAKGHWKVTLEAMQAGGPHELVVQGTNTLRLTGVLIGEVWVCSGQSNMQWAVRQSADSAREIALATFPQLRLLSVPRATAEQPATTFKGAWTACTPKSVANFSAVAYYFGRNLHRTLEVPVGLIHTSYGGTPAEAWMDRKAFKKHKQLKPLIERWKKAVARSDVNPNVADMRIHAHRPANLWNAMIAPLVPYAMRGVIWYQGESNAGRAEQYRTLFPAMIGAWRAQWGQGDFPFYFVQLANWRPRLPEPGPSAWAELREAQSLTLKDVPNTGMAVTIDIGDAANIHPSNKQDVGQRLAAWALAKDYGQRVVFSGPAFKALKKGKAGSLVLTFEHAAGGLETNDDDPVHGFAVAGKDNVFHWAEARIDGETIVLTCPKVKKPSAVRYGWADNPECNLTNKAGFPASPFRTDDLPLTTAGKN